MPSNGSKWLANVVNDGHTVAIYAYEGKIIHYKYGTGNNWQPWIKLATAEPPSYHHVSGIASAPVVGYGHYYKDQFNTITITARFSYHSSMASGMVLGVLPVGFRPIIGINMYAACAIDSVYTSQTFVTVHTNGRISLDLTPPPRTNIVDIHVSFAAFN